MNKENSAPQRLCGEKDLNQITDQIIGAAIEVHRAMGPGLLESVYEECLAVEFELRGIRYERQKPLALEYKGRQIGQEMLLDLLVEDKVVIELKAVEKLLSVHEAQLLTYLKLTGCHVGLLINFNVPVLKQGIKRMVNNFIEPQRRKGAEKT